MGGAALLLALCTFAAGCSNSLPKSVSDAPTLQVATGLYPLTQAAQLIGQKKAGVTNVVPAGSDPRRYQLNPSDAATVQRSGLAVEIGGGFQPSFESAATRATEVARLGPASNGNPYVWLDPASMGRAVTSLALSMESGDPAAAALFRRNATSLQAEISSLGIDYSSTLAACPGTTLVVPDGAFATMAASYGLKTIVVGSGAPAATITAAVNVVQASTSVAVISEPWVDNSGVDAVAASAHSRLQTLDTLTGPPAGGWPHGADYFGLMEQNLSVLSSALGCSSSTQ